MHGEVLELLSERALWWPRAATLFVADLHLGKATAFRTLGQPVPAGTTADNLARLSALVDRHAPCHVVFLGDFLHAPAANVPHVLEPVARWREAHAGVQLTLVRGNHDLRAGDPSAELGMAVVDEPFDLAPFAACHHPQRVPQRTVVAGHWHPAAVLSGPAHDAMRLPCFALTADESLLVLPAFGAFTGATVKPLPHDARRFAVGGGKVWAVPGRKRSALR